MDFSLHFIRDRHSLLAFKSNLLMWSFFRVAREAAFELASMDIYFSFESFKASPQTCVVCLEWLYLTELSHFRDHRFRNVLCQWVPLIFSLMLAFLDHILKASGLQRSVPDSWRSVLLAVVTLCIRHPRTRAMELVNAYRVEKSDMVGRRRACVWVMSWLTVGHEDESVIEIEKDYKWFDLATLYTLS